MPFENSLPTCLSFVAAIVLWRCILALAHNEITHSQALIHSSREVSSCLLIYFWQIRRVPSFTPGHPVSHICALPLFCRLTFHTNRSLFRIITTRNLHPISFVPFFVMRICISLFYGTYIIFWKLWIAFNA